MLKYHQIASFTDEKSCILDVGCGEGQLGHILTLKGCLVDGLDINIECNNLDETSVPSCLIDELGSQGEHPNSNEN